MTRVTNFGRKRTYVQAGFQETPTADTENEAVREPITSGPTDDNEEPGAGEPPKKRKRRSRHKKSTEKAGTEGNADGHGEGVEASSSSSKPKATKKKKEKKVREKKSRPITPSEARRLKRIAERNADTTCFACREKGHAARDCPNSRPADGSKAAAVGICYRCGSTRHTLSRCGKPVDPLNPLPHASCFVCSGKGHLAGACPQNKEKGIYPNGGCCKLCGDRSHLAKDCGLKKHDINQPIMMIGSGNADAGADEDDFHVFKRRTVEVEKDEVLDDRKRRIAEVNTVLQEKSTQPFVRAPPTETKKKKVVFF